MIEITLNGSGEVMTDTTTESTDTIRTGGFCVEVSPSSLRVTADKTALAPKRKSAIRIALKIAFYCGFGLLILINIADSIERHHTIFLIGLAVIFGLSLLFSIFRGRNDIYCTRDSLQVIRKIRGKISGKWTFPKNLVGPIRYAVFSSSRTGSTCGLLFSAQEKKIKVLSGLEIVEAYKILKELDRLGYEVTHDVGMPMAVEIELERRNSIFSLR
jgi:hypothetical protein